MARKPRSDSKLDHLPEPQYMALRDGLIDGTFPSYQEALSWLAVECGVESSPPALSRFYRDNCAPMVDQRLRFAAMKAEAFGDALAENPTAFDELAIERIKQGFFELASAPVIDAQAAKDLAGIIFKDRTTKLDDRKLRLLEEKAKQHDEAKEVLKEQIPVEEQNRRLREILK